MTDSMGSILVVEDNAALARVIRFNLERAGFDVTIARDGSQAWQRVCEQAFHLVVTDEQMPEMSGREFCQRLRGSEAGATLPVIMLTAKALELDRGRLRNELGIATVFTKPFSPTELVQAVHDCLAAAR
jgi:CheY-like chemotaxis protein